MKYRIKIVTYVNGRKEFTAQIKKGLIWATLAYDGEVVYYPSTSESREKALSRIDQHFAGNMTKWTIEFEYINK